MQINEMSIKNISLVTKLNESEEKEITMGKLKEKLDEFENKLVEIQKKLNWLAN